MPYSATDLCRDTYKILDHILETGEAVELERNGKLLRIIPADGLAPGDSVGKPTPTWSIRWWGGVAPAFTCPASTSPRRRARIGWR